MTTRRRDIHFPAEMLDEIAREAARLDRSISWVVREAWRLAHTPPFGVSVLVPVYNEEKNITSLLRALLSQQLTVGELLEVVVVASGCTDRTVDRVREVAQDEGRIRLILQHARLGKVAAINAYLRERDPTAEAIVICAGDVLPQPGALSLLVQALAEDPTLGMVGGRPVPTNPRGTLVGNMVNFLWELHHDRACEVPKLGELVALRASAVEPLDERSAVDEASLEALMARKDLRLRYLPEAVVTNCGPETLREFFEQRRRIAAGHYWLQEKTGYTVSTLPIAPVLRLALRHLKLTAPATDASYAVAALVEGLARLVGRVDLQRGHSHAVWTIAESAHRELTPPPAQRLERPPAPPKPRPMNARRAARGKAAGTR